MWGFWIVVSMIEVWLGCSPLILTVPSNYELQNPPQNRHILPYKGNMWKIIFNSFGVLKQMVSIRGNMPSAQPSTT